MAYNYGSNYTAPIKNSIEKKSISIEDLPLFLLFVLWFVEIELIGRLFLIEIVFLAIACWVLLTNFKVRILSSSFMKSLLLFGLCWFFAQVLTDWYRETPFVDYARGWAKIFFFGINIVAIYTLVRNKEERIILFILAMTIGGLIKCMIFPSVYYLHGQIWKFGYGHSITMLLILTTLIFRNKIYTLLILIALSAINLFFDFRSLALFCIGAAIIMIIVHFVQFAREKYIFEKKLIPRIPIIIVIFVIGITTFWHFYQLSGRYDIGIDVGQRHLKGKERNPLYGRLVILSGIKAIWDSPVIGYGSWARGMKYVYYLNEIRTTLGLRPGNIDSDLIPTHSYIIGGWVEAGIVGGIFWIFVLYHAIKALIYLIIYKFKSLPVFSFMIIGLFWSILFSPFALNARITTAFILIVISFILSKKPLMKEGELAKTST